MRSGWTEYRERIRAVVPEGGLKGRDAERAEMEAFCDSREPYWRWRAEPWAGKSALLASFAHDPPADVVVVAFFITVRDAAQNDSTAFIMTVTGQLEELLGDGYSGWQGTGNDTTRYLLLLKETARRLQASGKRLVLVVDGLDEDRGAERGQPSIASLLPKHGEHGLKVVVSGRPNPGIPADVPEDHPLRQPRITHRLREYSGAQRLRDTARLELHALLGGTELECDLLGLITAARGGLSEADLAELTQLPLSKLTLS